MKQLGILAILMAALLVTSCEKEKATGIGDALIVVKKSGSNTVYGISLYAYTFSTFTNVSAVSSANPEKTYSLKSSLGNFWYETPEKEFTTDQPAAATYTFSANFENGVHQEFQNTLTNEVLPVPTIDSCKYNPTYQRLEINWKIIPKAYSYAINILDGTHIVFGSNEIMASDLINPNTNIAVGAYTIKSTGGGWETDFVPVSGKTYTVRLFAYMYEPKVSHYNVQCISMANYPAVWGN